MTRFTNTSGNLSTNNSNTSLSETAYCLNNGNVVASTLNTITLDSNASEIDDIYNNKVIEIVYGSGNGQFREIIDYDGTTKIATLRKNLGELPTTNSDYIIHKNSGVIPLQTQTTRNYTIMLDSNASNISEFYKSTIIKLIYQNGQSENHLIEHYYEPYKKARICDNWMHNPEEGDLYIITGESGTAVTGTTNTITLDGNQTSIVNTGLKLMIYEGTGAGQTNEILSILTDVVTLVNNWDIIPDNTSIYTIFGGWAGTYENIVQYSALAYSLVIKNTENAIIIAQMAQNSNGLNAINKITELMGVSSSNTISSTSEYYRIVIIGLGTTINGTVQTTLGFNQGKIVNTISDNINDSTDCGIVRSVITGRSDDNGKYKNISTDYEGNLNVNIMQPRDIFGNMVVSEPHQLLEMKFLYPTSHLLYDIHLNGSGGFVPYNGLLTAYTGTTAESLARIRSVRRSYYTSGLGLTVRFSAVFSTPVNGGTQIIGHGDHNNGFFFGYNGLDFGCLRRYGGKSEIRNLQITTGASTTGDITVELNGETILIAVTAGDSIYDVARKIASQLIPGTTLSVFAAAGNGWLPFENNNSIIFTSEVSGPLSGSYSITGQSVAGTFSIMQVGVAATNNWIKMTEWNIDRLDETVSLPVIDFSKGNIYEINMQWLGFGNITFSIENPHNGRISLVHKIKYPNNNGYPSIYIPNQPLFLEAYNGGSTSNVSVSSSAMSSFVLGKYNPYNGARFGKSSIMKESLTVGKRYNILSLRNGPFFVNTTNIIEMLGLTVSASWKSSESGIFTILVNASLDNTTSSTWTPVKYMASPVEYCSDFKEIISGSGTEQISICMGTNNNFFETFDHMEIYMPPFYMLTLAIEAVTSTTDSEFSAGFYWCEKQ